MEPMKIQKRAGLSDFSTTQIYINLAGETFPEAAELLEERMLRAKIRAQLERPSPTPTTRAPHVRGSRSEVAAKRHSPKGRSGAGVEPTEPWVTRPHRF
jgi:hypothetical protein